MKKGTKDFTLNREVSECLSIIFFVVSVRDFNQSIIICLKYDKIILMVLSNSVFQNLHVSALGIL